MLIDILKMPPAVGIPISRRKTITTYGRESDRLGSDHIHWPNCPMDISTMIVGSSIERVPANLYKAIYISHDSRYVFESVFSVEHQLTICLYVKMITSMDIGIGISLKAIQFYHPIHPSDLIPFPRFVSYSGLGLEERYVDGIVPPIFDEGHLRQNLLRLNDMQREDVHSYGRGLPCGFGMMYKPIYDYEPVLIEALVEGEYRRPPLYEIINRHPDVDIHHDRWSNLDRFMNDIRNQGYHVHLNHPVFDTIALRFLHLLVPKLTITTSMSQAIQAQSDRVYVWTTYDYHDPYHLALRGIPMDRQDTNNRVSEILYQSAMAYCQLYSQDPASFMSDRQDQSSITIRKNIQDEIVITIYNRLTEDYVCFYTCFPVLALTTLGVGTAF